VQCALLIVLAPASPVGELALPSVELGLRHLMIWGAVLRANDGGRQDGSNDDAEHTRCNGLHIFLLPRDADAAAAGVPSSTYCGSVLFAGLSEIHLNTEFQQTAGQNLGWRAPLRTVGGVDREDRTCVEDVIDVELRLNALSGDSERPREPEIDLLYPVLVYRARRDQGNLDSAVRSGRQVANERRHDLRVGKRRGRGVHDAGQLLL